MGALQSAFDALARVTADRVLVAVSGGKDSICTLDVCVRKFGAANVVGFQKYIVPDLECEWDQIHRIEARYGIKVHGVPHEALLRCLKHGIYREHRDDFASMRGVGQKDVETKLRADTGIDWVAYGIRGTDSVVRRAWMKRIDGVDTKGRHVYPIWEWAKADVYGYLRARKLPVPRILGGGKVTGGIVLTGEALSWLKRECTHRSEPGAPSRCFAKVLAMFPYAGAAVYRHDEMKIDPIADARARFRKKKPDGEEVRAESAAPAGEAREG